MPQEGAHLAASEWPAETRDFVEARQERHYRKLATEMGFGGDAARAYRSLCGGAVPAEHFDPEKLRNKYKAADALSPDEWAAFDASVARQLEPLLSIKVPTAYEEPSLYTSMTMSLDQLRNSLDDEQKSTPKQMRLATLASGQVNAVIGDDPSGDGCIIYFERGLFRYFNHFSIVLGWCVPPIPVHDLADDAALAAIPSRYTMPSQSSAALGSVLYRYAVEGTPWSPAEYQLEPAKENMFLTLTLLSATERFVMAHEVSHVRRGHLDCPYADAAGAWAQEFEADMDGMELVIARDPENAVARSLRFWSCDLALTALHFLDQTLALLAFGKTRGVAWVSKTHPDALSRRQRLRDALAQRRTSLTELESTTAAMLCRMSDSILDRLWDIVFPLLLLSFRTRNATPSPMWRERIANCFSNSA